MYQNMKHMLTENARQNMSRNTTHSKQKSAAQNTRQNMKHTQTQNARPKRSKYVNFTGQDPAITRSGLRTQTNVSMYLKKHVMMSRSPGQRAYHKESAKM